MKHSCVAGFQGTAQRWTGSGGAGSGAGGYSWRGRALLAALFAAAFVSPLMAAGPASDDTSIGPAGMAQVAALLKEKESRTPAQRKIDSNILYEIRMRRGQDVAPGVSVLATGLSVDTDGLTAVDIRANVTDALLKRLAGMKALLIDVSKPYRTVAARLPLSEIEALAGMSEVIFIQPYSPANFWHERVKAKSAPPASPRNDLPPGFEERAQGVRAFLEDVLPSPSLAQSGSQNSQGDTTHQADVARATIGPNGSGVKVGVLSNGVVSLAASQALGDLGPVTVLPGGTGTGDEGTAMLEIVHDLAPGAQLYFATANPTVARFAQNIRDLRAAGCDIIIDDVFYFVETPFQDGQAATVVSNTNGGLIAQAVRDVVASGAMYFASAGNQGNVDDNTSSCYQDDWADGGVLALTPGGNVHDFGGGQQFDPIQTGSGNAINLYWADPLGGSSNDYDLFVLNSTGTAVVGSSTNIQSGTQDPFEQVGTGNTANNRIVVLKKAGAATRFFHITINANGVGKLGIATAGTTKGHSTAAGAFSVAATPAAPPGPYPNPFTAANVTETFSGDGPRRIFFDADGTPFTPGNFSSSGGTLRQKPDITAADRVSVTGVGGFATTFSGTSAAAPHAGAIAALLKSGSPVPANAAVAAALTSTAIDIEATGTDRDSGVGIVMPLPAMAALGMTSQAALDMGTFTVAELLFGSDGDGNVERGETGILQIANLFNNGPAGATGVSATLTSTTVGVAILPPASLAYPDISAGGSASNVTPYQFKLGAAYTCGAPVDFVLTVAYDDGSARSKVFKFTVPLATGLSVSTTMDATAPPASSHYTATTGTQTNRVTRDGNASTCGLPKPVAPGVTAATSPRFDAYTFTATNSGCNVVTITGGPNVAGGTQTFAVVYSGSFNPASITTNYLADAGSSPASGAVNSFSFNATAGQTYVVVVSEVPGTPPSPPYTVSVTGPSVTTCDVNADSGAYHTVAPCRVLDTRKPAGSFGGPPLSASTARTFDVAGQCGIPANAGAVAVNLTVTQSTASGFVIAYPTGSAVPLVSMINYGTGQTRANNAIVTLSNAGQIDLRCGQASGTVQVILDVSGYFVR